MVEVPLTWQLAKLGLSVSMVLGLSAIAVRASPRIAGLLSGYPLGTALALFFIGLEISPTFATQSAVHTLAGFTATMALGAGYVVTGRQPGIKGVISGVLGGFAAWLVMSTLLAQFSANAATPNSPQRRHAVPCWQRRRAEFGQTRHPCIYYMPAAI